MNRDARLVPASEAQNERALFVVDEDGSTNASALAGGGLRGIEGNEVTDLVDAGGFLRIDSNDAEL